VLRKSALMNKSLQLNPLATLSEYLTKITQRFDLQLAQSPVDSVPATLGVAASAGALAAAVSGLCFYLSAQLLLYWTLAEQRHVCLCFHLSSAQLCSAVALLTNRLAATMICIVRTNARSVPL